MVKLSMKLILTAMLLALGARAQTTNQLFLSWKNDSTHDSNVTFHVFSTTNIAQAKAQWEHTTNVDFVTATNSAKAGEDSRVEILPASDALRFYSVTASNFTGQSDFSESVSVRRVLPGVGLRIGAW